MYERNADNKIEISLLLDPKEIEESIQCYLEMQKVEYASLISNNSNSAPRKEDEKHQTFLSSDVEMQPRSILMGSCKCRV